MFCSGKIGEVPFYLSLFYQFINSTKKVYDNTEYFWEFVPGCPNETFVLDLKTWLLNNMTKV